MRRISKSNAEFGNFNLFIVLTIAVLINVAQYPLFGRRIEVRETSSLVDIGLHRGGAVRDRRHLYLSLAKFTPHVDLILPNDEYAEYNEIDQLYGLARINKIIRKEYDSKKFAADISFTDYIVTSGQPGKDRGPGPYAIALGEKYSETLILLRRDGVWFFVDVSLIPKNVLDGLSQ